MNSAISVATGLTPLPTSKTPWANTCSSSPSESMPVVRTIQDKLLAPSREALDAACRDPSSRTERLGVLEALAAALGGFSLESYAKHFQLRHSLVARHHLEQLKAAVLETGIESAIALAALADSPLGMARREKGAYYTDYRLARRLADAVGV